ncbi:MAG: GtrA family protein [Bacteroidota bacterium]|nr:GtrA family protein [Bacteroidota bacterium]
MQSYVRFTASSIVSTIVDYGVTITLTDLASLLYVVSSAIGMVSGGVTSYQLNRRWVFQGVHGGKTRIPVFYALNWAANLLINTAGLYALTEGFAIDYRLSKIITAVCIGFFLNYVVQKRVVFRS